jgi:hypothetical protein
MVMERSFSIPLEMFTRYSLGGHGIRRGIWIAQDKFGENRFIGRRFRLDHSIQRYLNITSASKHLKGCHAGLDACPYRVFAGMTEIQLFYCRSNSIPQ